MSFVLVILEQKDGAVTRISLEALAAGQQLAAATQQECAAVVLGDSTATAAKELDFHALAHLYTIDHPLLKLYTPDGYKLALQPLIQKTAPAYVVLPHTYQVRDFAPSLAAAFGQSLISDVIAVRVDGGAPVFVRQLFQGKLNGEYRRTEARTGPGFFSVQAGSFRVEDLKSGGVSPEPFAAELAPEQIRTRPEAPFRDAAQTVDLGAAQVIVSVGRGIREQENMGLVESLAKALGAELAASRPICDAGWLPIERQVGSSGQTVAPKVYLAVGISGAIQHLVGMKGSKTVIAINKDENAPIFEVADYGVAGDLFEIVPELTRAIQATRA